MRPSIKPALFALAALAVSATSVPFVRAQDPARPKVTVGSKEFAESNILGAALALLLRESGAAEPVLRPNLGGTDFVYKALLRGDIDVYPDYTGTIAQVLMKAKGRPTGAEMRAFLGGQGIGMSESLGFNDGYALAVMPAVAEKLGLRKISDLAAHRELRLGFTHEFVGRQDGWKGLAAHYGLNMPNVRGMQHALAYTAISSGQIDVMEIYTTDAKLEKLGLRMLEDDRSFFPRYDAVLLYRADLPGRAPEAFRAMERLVGRISEAQMIRANAMVEIEKRSESEAAAALLAETLGSTVQAQRTSVWNDIGGHVLEHLKLVGISLLAAILAGVPLGILASKSRWLAAVTLAVTGLVQTIPSLALLAFLIPVVGIGDVPALVALFLYGLLPIVRSTYTGLTTLPPNLIEAAEAIGLSPMAQLLRVRLPMASPAIMSGIKTSAVINVGTATIAAFIGAGGLGAPIKAGIDLQRTDLLLQGAIPAAVLALLVQGGFDLLDRVVVPKGLRIRPADE